MARDVHEALLRELRLDLEALRTQLFEALLENKRLRQQLRVVLNCTDTRCSVCATCLEAVRGA